MNRTGLIAALAVAVVIGLLFGIFPQLDLAISRFFHQSINPGFALPTPGRELFRDAFMWIVAALVAPAFIAVALKLILPRSRMIVPARAALFLIVTLAVAPGLLTNVILKDYWGRPRPYAVTEFGGKEPFVPWWDPRGGCRVNCSFVAGEPSGAFWTFAPAALAPPAWRALAYGAVVAFGLANGVMRIAFGAHFFSDVVFAGVFTFLVVWLAHGLIYRWPRTRLDDAALERQIARATLPLHDAVMRLFGGKRRI